MDRYHYVNPNYKRGGNGQQNFQNVNPSYNNPAYSNNQGWGSNNSRDMGPSEKKFKSDTPDPNYDNNTVFDNSMGYENAVPKTDPASTPGDSSGTEPKQLSKKSLRKMARKALNCSSRKRLTFWMKHGKPFSEAIKICTQRLWMVPDYKIIKEEKKRIKKERRESKIKEVEETGLPIVPIEKEAKIKVRLKPTPLVTIANGEEPMTEAQMEIVRDEILKAVELAKGDTELGFTGCSASDGMLILTCSNNVTRKWLVKSIKNIKTFDDAKLRIAETPEVKIIAIWIPDPDISESSLIIRLENQNMGVKFQNWKLLDRKINKNGQHVKYSVDDESLEAIKRKGYRLILNNGTVKINILPTDYLKVLASTIAGLHGPIGKPVTEILRNANHDEDSNEGDSARSRRGPSSYHKTGPDRLSQNDIRPFNPGPGQALINSYQNNFVAPGPSSSAPVARRKNKGKKKKKKGNGLPVMQMSMQRPHVGN